MGGRCFREERYKECQNSIETLFSKTFSEASDSELDKKETLEGIEITPKMPILIPKIAGTSEEKGSETDATSKAEYGVEAVLLPKKKTITNANRIKWKEINLRQQQTLVDYQLLREKTMKVFSEVAGNSSNFKVPQRKVRRKNKAKVKEKLGTMQQVVEKSTDKKEATCDEESKYTAKPIGVKEVLSSYGLDIKQAKTTSNKIIRKPPRSSQTAATYSRKRRIPIIYVKKPTLGFYDKLNAEIGTELQKANSYFHTIFSMCETIKNRIQRTARSVFENKAIKVVTYGSMATGLAFEESDLDLAIFGLSIYDQESLGLCIAKFKDTIEALPIVLSCEAILTARVPLAKLQVDLIKLAGEGTKWKTLKVDIIFESILEEDYSAADYAVEHIDLVLERIKEIPILKTLVILFKKLLCKYHLNIPYFGGMNSYVLSLMLYAYLNTIFDYESVAHSFIDILKYYGTEFDPNLLYICENAIALIPLQEISLVNQLYVSEPFRPEINAAASVTRFCEIQDCFRRVYETLMQIKEKYEQTTDKGILDKIF